MPKARANGIELHYESFGDGEPLLLIMGIGAQMIQWDEEFCRVLAARGFRVIRFDNRDVGESEILDRLGAPDLRKVLLQRSLRLSVDAPYTLDDMADDTAGLLDALEIPAAHVVGMSLGGMVAQCLALRHPQRVQSLGLMMTAPGNLLAGIPTLAALRALTGRGGRGEEGAIRYQVELFRVIGASPHRTPEARLREIAALHYKRGVQPRGFARQFAAVMGSRPRLHRLHHVRAPTHAFHGAEDPLIPALAGRLIAARIPGALLSVIAGMGHDMGPTSWPYVVEALTKNARRTLPDDARPMGFARALARRPIEIGATRT
jgi:pimeloyl-ACP methyl ester carboxylesterase